MFRSGALLAGGTIAAALFQLARNILVARLVSVEDYGIAVTFAIVMAALEMTSAFALDRLIVQAKDGDDETFQSVMHSLHLIRGAVMAALMLGLAYPVAALFGLSEIAWAYQLLAVVPLVRGAVHFDMFRAERKARFAPRVRAEVLPLAISAAAAGGLALALGDWRAMLWAVVLQHLLYAAMSWLQARRRYRLSWDRPIAARALRFGWPLLVNGALMYMVFQGDRIIVGNRLGPEALGLFGAAFTLTLMASLVLAKPLESLAMPRLAPLAGDAERLAGGAIVAVEAGLLIGVVTAVGTALIGPAVLLAVFGPKYASALPLVAWLGLMQGVRVAKAGASIVAVATGETLNPMLANLARIAVLPLAFLALEQGGGLLTVIWIGLAGETLAFVVSFRRLRKTVLLPLPALAVPLLATGAVFVCVAAALAVRPPADGPFLPFQTQQAWLLGAVALYLVAGLPRLRGYALARSAGPAR